MDSNFASDYGACVLQICIQCELSATFYYSPFSSMHKQGYV